MQVLIRIYSYLIKSYCIFFKIQDHEDGCRIKNLRAWDGVMYTLIKS